MTDICYICTTPFQLMTVLSIQIENGLNADLFIDPQFEEAQVYAERIKQIHAFNNVYIIDDNLIMQIRKEKIKVLRAFKLLRLYFGKTSRNITHGNKYKEILTSSDNLIHRLIYNYCKKECNTSYFDDGEGTYDRFDSIFKNTNNLLSKDYTIKLYLYSPEFFLKLNNNYKSIKLIPISNWSNSIKISSIINSIFSTKEDISIKEKIIILDTVRSESLDSNSIELLDKVYNLINDRCDKKDIIIKRHPRDKTVKQGFSYYNFNHIPFEYIALKSNIQNKVLVTLSSTSVIMPKIVMGQEPTVLLLYKLIKFIGGDNDKRNLLYDNCRQLYKDKQKFIIPNNWDDLNSAIKHILKL